MMANEFPIEVMRSLLAKLSGLPRALVLCGQEPEPMIGVRNGELSGLMKFDITSYKQAGGSDDERYEVDETTGELKLTISGVRNCVISIRVWIMRTAGGLSQATDVLDRVWTRLARPVNVAILQEAGLAIGSQLLASDLPPEVIDDREYGKAILDFEIGFAINDVDDDPEFDGGVIEHALWEGAPYHPTPTATVFRPQSVNRGIGVGVPTFQQGAGFSPSDLVLSGDFNPDDYNYSTGQTPGIPSLGNSGDHTLEARGGFFPPVITMPNGRKVWELQSGLSLKHTIGNELVGFQAGTVVIPILLFSSTTNSNDFQDAGIMSAYGGFSFTAHNSPLGIGVYLYGNIGSVDLADGEWHIVTIVYEGDGNIYNNIVTKFRVDGGAWITSHAAFGLTLSTLYWGINPSTGTDCHLLLDRFYTATEQLSEEDLTALETFALARINA